MVMNTRDEMAAALKRRKDMAVGHLYIVQYPHSPYFK